MTLTAHDGAVQSEHDQIVNLIAQRWATVTKCKVTINTTSEKEPWLGVDRKYPDRSAGNTIPKRNTVEWIAEVETEDCFSVFDAHGRWMDYMAFGVPFYLFVPKGCRELANSSPAERACRSTGCMSIRS
ncbi:MAG: hypothetical protein ABI945_05960 [Nitrospirales bacterium]